MHYLNNIVEPNKKKEETIAHSVKKHNKFD